MTYCLGTRGWCRSRRRALDVHHCIAYGVLAMAYSVPDLAISTNGLVKRFGSTVALDGLDPAVPSGTVCGLLGPNGAGKTTAVRVLATLLRFDAGRAFVAGFDVASQAAEVRFRICSAA